MLGWVMFKKRQLLLRFTMTEGSGIEKAPYSLGGALSDFTAVSPQISEKLFQILKKKFVSDVSVRIDTPTMGAYVPFLRKALETNPYMFLYLKFYAQCLILSCDSKVELTPVLKDFLCKEVSERNLGGIIALADAEQTADWLGQIILEDFEYRRNRTKKQLERVVFGTNGLEKYTPAQRMFILTKESGSGLAGNFNVSLTSEHNFERTANLGTVKASLLESDATLLEEYEINTPDDLIALEMFRTVAEELPVKKCRCCGELFVPMGRSDSEYCSRISLGEDKRCAQIGAMKTFKGKHAEDPIYVEYNRAYKRNHSRLRNGKLYEEEFRSWSVAARKARDEFINNGKTVEEFKLKLKELEVEG